MVPGVTTVQQKKHFYSIVLYECILKIQVASPLRSSDPTINESTVEQIYNFLFISLYNHVWQSEFREFWMALTEPEGGGLTGLLRVPGGFWDSHSSTGGLACAGGPSRQEQLLGLGECNQFEGQAL